MDSQSHSLLSRLQEHRSLTTLIEDVTTHTYTQSSRGYTDGASMSSDSRFSGGQPHREALGRETRNVPIMPGKNKKQCPEKGLGPGPCQAQYHHR